VAAQLGIGSLHDGMGLVIGFVSGITLWLPHALGY